MINEIVKIFDGGEGSGHFKHVGIPNYKGGSARSGEYRNKQNKKYKEGHITSLGKTRKQKIKERIKGITNNDAKRYDRALENYTGIFYGDIKKAYRDKYSNKKFDKSYEQISNDLDDFIYRSEKYKGLVYRGLSVDEEVALNIIKKLKQGKTMDMQGISSWSSDKKVSLDFSNESDKDKNVCIVFNLDNKSGVSIKELSEFESESEVLHPTTSRYKLKGDGEIKRSKTKNGKILFEISLQEI